MNSMALLALPAVPAFSALILALFGTRLSYNAVGGMASAAAGISFVVALGFLSMGILGGAPVFLDLGPWLSTHDFQADLKFRLDSAGLCMVLLVTFFGFLITVYSVGYMREDREQGKFFAGLNLFVASMLTLVLSDNLVLIFLGWEGVGLCSYLLIGHYWNEKGVPLAAFRAFFVNRIGDLFFLLGVFMIYQAFGTISLSNLSAQGPALISGHAHDAAWAALFLLGGAFAKSAQAPLHIWLADAMAGPTPVSALIHAATMVTAGVYLVMRLDWLYAAVPQARFVMSLCGFVTLAVGATMALTQTDIKKILAYSTLSNLALMFLALGAGSSGTAMLHLFGHAFFKALLFLAAGSVILAVHHEQDIRKLKGVLKSLPVTRVAFWVGCVGGAGLIPYFSAGFFTKEAVLESIRFSSLDGFGIHISGGLLYGLDLAVEMISALYMFRLLGYLESDDREEAYSHGGESHHGHAGKPRETSPAVRVVLGILAVAAPSFAWFSSRPALLLWLGGVRGGPMHWSHVVPGLIFGLILSALAFAVFSNSKRRQSVLSLTRFQGGKAGPFARKFYFDDIYSALIVFPLKSLAWFLRLALENVFIGHLTAVGWIANALSKLTRHLQSGQAHRYAACILFATALGAWFLLRN